MLNSHFTWLLGFTSPPFVSRESQLFDPWALYSLTHNCYSSQIAPLCIAMLIIDKTSLSIWTLKIHLTCLITTLRHFKLIVLSRSMGTSLELRQYFSGTLSQTSYCVNAVRRLLPVDHSLDAVRMVSVLLIHINRIN